MNSEQLIDIAGLSPFAYGVELWHWVVLFLLYLGGLLALVAGKSSLTSIIQTVRLRRFPSPFSLAASTVAKILERPQTTVSSLHEAALAVRNALFLATGLPFHSASPQELHSLYSQQMSTPSYTQLLALLRALDELRFSRELKTEETTNVLKQLHSVLQDVSSIREK